MDKDIIIFSLSSNKELTNKIAKILGICVGNAEIYNFSDGEVLVKTVSEVSMKTVFIIQSTNYPAAYKIFEILVFMDALKNAGAKQINLVIPYFGYSRQDRVAFKGEPITAKMVATLYQAVGANKVISVDLHTPQIQGFFNCPVISLDPCLLFANYYKDLFVKRSIKESDVCVVSPDHGSALRARDLCSMFENSSLIMIDKRRPAPNKSEVTNIIGDVKDKTCIIIDDIIDTCGTINNAAEELKKNGARDIFVCATHPVLSNSNISPLINDIVVTDTIEHNESNIKVLSVANLIADAIRK